MLKISQHKMLVQVFVWLLHFFRSSQTKLELLAIGWHCRMCQSGTSHMKSKHSHLLFLHITFFLSSLFPTFILPRFFPNQLFCLFFVRSYSGLVCSFCRSRLLIFVQSFLCIPFFVCINSVVSSHSASWVLSVSSPPLSYNKLLHFNSSNHIW